MNRSTVFLAVGSLIALTMAALAFSTDVRADPKINAVPSLKQGELGLVVVRQILSTNTTTTGNITTTETEYYFCSGTLLNQYWVLTANHCATTDQKKNGPKVAATKMRISNMWQGSESSLVTPTEIYPFYEDDSLDVALIYLGNGDFGRSPRPFLDSNGKPKSPIFKSLVDTSTKLRKFGRGGCATQTCAYRTADFNPSLDSEWAANLASGQDFVVPITVDDASAICHRGDSGGPNYVIDAQDSTKLLGIAGVTSEESLVTTSTSSTSSTTAHGCRSDALHNISGFIDAYITKSPAPKPSSACPKPQ